MFFHLFRVLITYTSPSMVFCACTVIIAAALEANTLSLLKSSSNHLPLATAGFLTRIHSGLWNRNLSVLTTVVFRFLALISRAKSRVAMISSYLSNHVSGGGGGNGDFSG